jgi:hypothetical protein
MKDNFLYPVTEVIHRTEEPQFPPGDSDIAVMWVSGLAATQTTLSTSTQAAPAPQPEDWN